MQWLRTKAKRFIARWRNRKGARLLRHAWLYIYFEQGMGFSNWVYLADAARVLDDALRAVNLEHDTL